MNPKKCPFRPAKSHMIGLLTEPYRPFFAVAAFYNLIVMGLWFVWLHGLEMGRAFLSFQISPIQSHFHWMVFGFSSFYLFGFLLTAFPKWVSAPQSKGPYNIFLALALFSSQALVLVGTLVSVSLLKLALAFEFFLMVFLTTRLFKIYFRQTQKKIFDQSSMVLFALGFGILAQLFFQWSVWGTYSSYFSFYSFSLYLAQFPFLLFLMLAVSYRILPFFTSNLPPQTEVQRGRWSLHGMLLLVFALGLLEFLPFLKSLVWLKGLVFLAMALLFLKEIHTWQWKKSFSHFLLLSHYVAFLWAVLFLLFKSAQAFSPLLSQNYGISLAIQHLFFLGSFSTLIWGISTRVTRGHGGLGFQLGSIDYLIFILLQLAAILRVLLPFLEIKWGFLREQSVHAAFLWWLAFFLWGIRYLPVLIGGARKNTEKIIPQSIQAGAR